MTVFQLGKLKTEWEGHFTYQSSAPHFCLLSSAYYFSDSFLLNSFSWKAVLFSSPPSQVFRPSPCTLVETPNLLTVKDGRAEAHNGRRGHVISLAAGLWKKEPKPKPDPREADLIKITAKTELPMGCRDEALRCSSRRKIQESRGGRMFKGGEKEKT